MGTVAKFVSMMGYTQQFSGMAPGSAKFSAKWKELARNPQFGEDQHEFIKKTHFIPQLNHLKKNGIDLSQRGPAVQDAIWSTSVQFGGATNLIINALKGLDVDKITDCTIASAIQNYKIANNNALFKSSSPAVRSSTLNRAKNEKKDLLELCEMSPPAPPQVNDTEAAVIGVIDMIFDKVASIGESEENNTFERNG